MRYLTALFDAPVPARLALALLAEGGVGAADLGVFPVPPPSEAPPQAAHLLAGAGSPEALAALLARLGLPVDHRQQVAEGLGRGAILVMARVPDLAAPDLARRLAAASPLGPAEARAWALDPGLRYRWAEGGLGQARGERSGQAGGEI